jgi:hypothetical protein
MFTLGVNISRSVKSAGNPRQYWVWTTFKKNLSLILRRGTEKTAEHPHQPPLALRAGGSCPHVRGVLHFAPGKRKSEN